MSQRILGVDLGSHSVKLAVIDTGFRQAELVSLHERVVPHGEAPLAERQATALADLLSELERGADAVVHAALPGQYGCQRGLTLPFQDAKKIEPVLPFELEPLVPFPVEELVIDWIEIDRSAEGIRLLAVAAPRERVSAFIDQIAGAVGSEPRTVTLGSVAYGILAARLPSDGDTARMIVDLGHQHTQVLIVRAGRPLFARSIARGGAQVTDAIVRAYTETRESAERAKHRTDLSLLRPDDAPSRAVTDLSRIVAGAIEPLAASLVATLVAARTEIGVQPVEVLLCGGGSRMAGLAELLSARLELPVRPLTLPAAPDLARVEEARQPGPHALALAVALIGVDGQRQGDLRRGELAYKADYSFLRQRALQIAACVLAVLAASAVNAFASLQKLRREETLLTERLKRETQEVFGQPMVDAEEVSKRMTMGRKGVEVPTVEASAFDLLEEISKKLPPGDKTKIDVTELDLRSKKSFLKGTAESAAVVDEIKASLESIDCFSDVVKGTISNAAADKELKSWSITLTSRCP